MALGKMDKNINKVSHKYDRDLADQPESSAPLKPTLGDRLNAAFRKLRPSKHRGMEHKGITALICLILLTSGGGLGYTRYLTHMRLQAETKTRYNAEVPFSKSTGTTLKLDRLRLSGDKRTAYVPFSFNNMDTISEDANKYSVFVGATNGGMKQAVSGRMVLFGSIARGVIILHSIHRIANQTIDVFIRNNAQLNMDDEEQTEPDINNSNQYIKDFEQKYDALHFKVNPGARGAVHNRLLTTHDDPNQIYMQLFGQADRDKALRGDTESRSKIKIDLNVAKEFSSRLKKMGFRLPKTPKWMSSNWRPYDAIMSNGIPRNEEGRANAKDVADDAAYSPVNDKQDTQDQVQFPNVLKKKDGTTTNSQNSSTVNGGPSGGSDNSNGGQSHINGGNVNSPSELWAKLQQAWNEVLTLKHNIYTTNAATLFKVKATVNQQNKMASIADKKHFKQLN